MVEFHAFDKLKSVKQGLRGLRSEKLDGFDDVRQVSPDASVSGLQFRKITVVPRRVNSSTVSIAAMNFSGLREGGPLDEVLEKDKLVRS